MKNNLVLIVSIFFVSSFSLYTGCEQQTKPIGVGVESSELHSPHYWKGERAAKGYMAEQFRGYRIVIMLNDIDPSLSGREDFLKGFNAAFAEVDRAGDGIKYSKIFLEAASSSEFETAQEMGSKHAQGLVTNSQIQNLIHSSLGVSRSRALGWKAGYVKGFKTQRVSDAKKQDKSADKQTTEDRFYKEAAATYNALRAATGQ